MNKEKISSQEIIDLVAAKASVSKRAAEEFLKVMIATIEEALMADDVVKIKGFGTFKLQWNEPRKSVNVQTGEEIVLEGYHKVSFAPETSLKDLVNEPFAHLEPVLLDGDNNFIIDEKPDEVTLDPLRIFTDQASEIKDLLSEIQALSPIVRKKDELPVQVESVVKEEVDVLEELVIQSDLPEEGFEVQETVELPEFIADEVTESSALSGSVFEPELVNEPIVEREPEFEVQEELESSIEASIAIEQEPDFQPELKVVEELQTIVPEDVDVQSVYKEQVAESISEEQTSEIEFTPFLVGIKPAKKIKKWFWTTALLLFLSGAGLYIFFQPARILGNNIWTKTTIEVVYLNKQFVNVVLGWFATKPKVAPKVTETVVIPKDTSALDSAEIAEPIDTLQQLFNNPRVYEEFISSEQINKGSRLTIMSKKYYGNKDFWVYIYEANKERINNPDNIEMGTLIRIPKLNPKLIDASNPLCIEKARELHDLYVKKKVAKDEY
jgi:nucleoid DNA-binding protein